MSNYKRILIIVLLCVMCSAETKVAVAPRSTMATSQIMKGISSSCPSVSIVLDETGADYIIVADREKDTEWLKHYRITLFDKQSKAVFSTDKHSPGASMKEVCEFRMHPK